MLHRARRHRVLPITLMLMAVLAACGGPKVPLAGTITNAYTNEPIASATVKLGETSVTTDAQGRFQLATWSPKDKLELSANGFEAATVDLATQPDLASPAASTASYAAKLRPNTLSGVVTDATTGEPVPNAVLKVSDTVSATTGTDGKYTLAGVPESFQLSVTAPDHDVAEQSGQRQTALDVKLRSNVVTGTLTDSFTGQPIAGATVKAGDATATTDDKGAYRLENVPEGAQVAISAEGYAEQTAASGAGTTVDATLRPDALKSTLVDAASGKPIANATVLVTPSITGTAEVYQKIDNSADGSFAVDGLPEQGYLQVLAPGYKKAVVELKPGEVPNPIKLEPFVAKALYVTAAVASSSKLMAEYFDLIDTTELNTIVIDLKSDLRDDLGLVYYDSQAPMAKEMGTTADYMDLPGLIAEAKKRGIYTIARVQLFSHDNALADAHPEWAIQDKEKGGVYADYPGPGIRYAYLDPTNQNVWKYNIELSVEAAGMGFDEINYDYVRFPDWYGAEEEFTKRLGFSKPLDAVNRPEEMFSTLTDFLQQAQQAVNGAGAYMSIDIFGRVVLGKSMTIAQDIGGMAPYTDYIAPMPYPSLWWPGFLDFDNPTAHPYEVMKGALEAAAPRFEGKRAKLRPWLQDHTDPWQGSRVVEYGPKEVRAQIDAANEVPGVFGWMLYDSANTYTEGALKPE